MIRKINYNLGNLGSSVNVETIDFSHVSQGWF